MKDNNSRIIKNTFFLYFRMLLIMAVSLYTSRVTLRVLGVDDFGIYQAVAGAVTFLAFVSNALGSGTSRFIIYEMGKDKPRLDILFATVRVAHIILGILIVIIGEVVGLWIVYNKLVIPAERINASIFAFHFSIVATFFKITVVPYNACIIAHENMDIYALISIIEAFLNLAIVYILQVFSYDKLETYALLICFATIIIMIIYRLYCRKKYEETRTKLMFDKEFFKGVASFSGWNLLTSSAGSLANQGITIVTNMFFAPSVVTVRTLSLRINEITNQFVGNYRNAVNPQIVKKYAAKDFEGSRNLALTSTQLTYYLMLLIVVPLFFLIEPMLKIWLVNVPHGLIPFAKIALIQGLFQAIDTSLYVPIYAKGQIRENAIISPLFDSLQFPIVYFLFKRGYPPITLAWVSLAAYAILGIIVKPILVRCIAKYNYFEIIKMIFKCFCVTFFSVLLPILFSAHFDSNKIFGFVAILLISLFSVSCSVWILGIEKSIKKRIISFVLDKSNIWKP